MSDEERGRLAADCCKQINSRIQNNILIERNENFDVLETTLTWIFLALNFYCVRVHIISIGLSLMLFKILQNVSIKKITKIFLFYT